MPDHAITFGGGATATTLTPIVLVALLLATVLVVALPRKYGIVPLSCMLFLVPIGQQVVVGGVHLFVSRLIILAGLSRLLFASIKGEKKILAGGFNSLDRAFLWFALVQAIAVVLLFRTGNAFINQVGFIWDFLGGYFLLRFLVHDEEDIFRLIKCLAALALVIGICMVREDFTRQNIFGLIGGNAIPGIREGRVRCQGPFEHELMAGAFGSTLIPVFFLLWKSRKARMISALGLIGALLMTWTSASSTSLLACAASALGIAMWPIRKKMRTVRWGIVGGLIGLQMVMKAPVWFVIAHINLVGGSSSYHRAELVDQFVRHFWSWWLIGVKETGSWGLDMWDAQNQFVNVGETGGLLALVFFIAVISQAFARLGNARKAVEGDTSKEWTYWLLGAAVFSNVVAFFGVNYFDQTKYAWFSLLAIITAATVPVLKAAPATESAPTPVPVPHFAFSPPRLMPLKSKRTADARFKTKALTANFTSVGRQSTGPKKASKTP